MVTLIISLFLLGYLAITLENYLKVSKALIACITAFVLWGIVFFWHRDDEIVLKQLAPAVLEAFKIVLFLIGAMTIVAFIDIQDGFFPITKTLASISGSRFVWAISIATFCLSALLDNLTTTIVMVAIIKKIIENNKSKWYLLGLVIIAANAGGAFSPIGDITTTMLWMGGQITPIKIVMHTFFPSCVCMVIPTIIIQIKLKGHLNLFALNKNDNNAAFNSAHRYTIFYSGIGCILLIPFLKFYFDIPAYLGMIIGVGIMGLITMLFYTGMLNNGKGWFPFVGVL